MSALTSFTQGEIDTIGLVTSTPSHGTVTTISPSVIRYTPTTGYAGSDSFGVSLNCATNTVNMSVVAAPSTITIQSIDQSDPYSNSNIRLKVNGTVPTGGTINDSGVFTYTAHYGDVITFEAFSVSASTGINATKDLLVVMNGATVYPLTTGSNNPGDPDLVAGPFTITSGDSITATASAHADPDISIIACGTPTTYSGNEGFPNYVYYNLGSALGSVTFTFDAFTIPDRYVGYIGGVQVFDTGYRGDPANQSSLNSALASHGLPPSTIISPGSGSLTFNKTVADNICTIEIYSPVTGTAWNLTMSCPV